MIVVNERVINQGQPFKDNRICLSRSDLQEGENVVFIHFASRYSSSDGHGIVRTEDSDGEIYLKTNLFISEGAGLSKASKIFPCFEFHEDLKSQFGLVLIHP